MKLRHDEAIPAQNHTLRKINKIFYHSAVQLRMINSKSKTTSDTLQ